MIYSTLLSIAATASMAPGITGPAVEIRGFENPAGIEVNEIPTFPVPDDNPIMTLPSGATQTVLLKTGTGWVNTQSGPQSQDSEGSITDIAFAGDDVYMRNIFSVANATAWLKGTRSGNKVTFEFPQCVDTYSRDEDGIITDYYEYVLMADKIGDLVSYSYYPADDQTLTFTIQEDGTWYNDQPDRFIGKFYWYNKAYSWAGGGEYLESLSPITATTCDVPSDVDFEDWTLISNDGALQVKVGFAGDKCYLRNIALGVSDMPDATVVGDVKADGTITFEANQYLGTSASLRHTIWFRAGTMEEVEDPTYGKYMDFIPNAPLVMTYDSKFKSMETEDGAFSICYTTSEFRALNIYAYPTIRYVAPGTPIESLRDPIKIAVYYPEENYPVYEIQFISPNYSYEDVLIPLSDLYYEVWIDGKLFTFNKSSYEYLPKDMTEIQCGYCDYWGFYSEGSLQKVMFDLDSINNLAVRLLYHQSDGSILYSDFVHFIGDETGMAEIGADNVESVSYYDLEGRALKNPAQGLVIRVERLSDGSTRASKHFIR
ncbi:MAG: hypothetical protein HDR80_02905 [Bacteroides sp.]|nr:hypothetical protein [Bacteroides sp.]